MLLSAQPLIHVCQHKALHLDNVADTFKPPCGGAMILSSSNLTSPPPRDYALERHCFLARGPQHLDRPLATHRPTVVLPTVGKSFISIVPVLLECMCYASQNAPTVGSMGCREGLVATPHPPTTSRDRLESRP